MCSVWVLFKNIKENKENKKSFKITKTDVLQILVVLALFIGITMYLLLNSYDTIQAIMNTEYPGQRLELGGLMFSRYFESPTNLFFNVNINNILYNTCEEAYVFDFFPFGLLLMLYVFIKEKKKDLLLILLTILDVFLGIWCIFGFPEILAKITLLSFSQSSRTVAIVGFINLFILIRSLSLMKTEFKIVPSTIISIICTAITILCTNHFFGYYLHLYMILIIAILYFVCFYSFLRFKKSQIASTALLVTIFFMSVLGGLIVNPIRHGIDIIYKTEINKNIRSIVEKDNSALWIVEGPFPFINIPIMSGAKTINCTNIYPNLEIWEKLDKNKENSEIYNRYAHIAISIVNTPTKFELIQPDYFMLYLNVKDLNTLGVKYILTTTDLKSMSTDSIKFTNINESNSFKIYQVEYK